MMELLKTLLVGLGIFALSGLLFATVLVFVYKWLDFLVKKLL
jgi:hypothetical protein